MLAQDFSTVLEWLTSSYEHSNIVLVGHSLGGLVVAQASSDSSLTIHTNAKLRPRGVLLSAPAISIFVPGTINKILAPLVPLVVRIPGMETNTKASDLSASELSHDESVVKAYESDPLMYVSIDLFSFLPMICTVCEVVLAFIRLRALCWDSTTTLFHCRVRSRLRL